MALRELKPTSPGRRFMTVPDFAEITKKRPERSLLDKRHMAGGRNNSGRMTVRFRGGGNRKQYRVVDFKRRKDEHKALVAAVEYDPNRNCRVALLHYEDGEKRYILAPAGIRVGAVVESGERVELNVGNSLPLRNMPAGLQVHNVELTPGHGGQLARSAGTSVTLTNKEGEHAILTLPSGEVRRVLLDCRATVGAIGNADFQLIWWGKAGRNRHRGFRPHNRGTSQNPVDHPMGGGEGRSGGGRHPCSPNGVLAKGGKTRGRKKASNRLIVRRRRSRRYG
ncbi:MAG: 50S ribosomal protein L2 [Planctomycetes bacterium]|nr:50S ribosomal protein L2 [Planctomycetota bacterium]